MKNRTKLIFSPQLARRLLQSGFKIVDIKPSKNGDGQTVFVFEIESGFGKVIQEWLEEVDE